MRALSHARPEAFEHRQALGYGSGRTVGSAGRSGTILRGTLQPRTGPVRENRRPGGALQGAGPRIGSCLGPGQGHCRALDGGWDAVVGASRRFGGSRGRCPGFTG
ncbi:hypothetical protein [Arthrobacter sp. C9C5]|uniref:hypothetical protein n=1 Tax=Arthrobacter sp. C9C5 TaxID=2735267 RepID=UPI001585C6FF|nr:hypothetical protein [Arthrobacter sp. C9C5]NUU32164.1 hypothetical protein [Arthrobacter sp. C9C5]